MTAQKSRRGIFITFEGTEGSGKTTLAKSVHHHLKKGRQPVLLTYEPGHSSLGKILRRALLSSVKTRIEPLSELFLFEADRAQHVKEVIVPALKEGKIVLCGRYCDSTLAYQGYGRGLDLEMIRSLNHGASGGLEPDLTLLLDIAPEKGLPRAFKARGKKDRIESEEMAFHRRLRKGFLKIARQEPSRVKVIRASQSLENVEAQALDFIRQILVKHHRTF